MMNKLTYSHKNAAFNGKTESCGRTVFGFYSSDGRFYLAAEDEEHYNGKFIVASSDFEYTGYTFFQKYAAAVSALRGISYSKACDYLERLGF